MRCARASAIVLCVVLCMVLNSASAAGQNEPATIPTVVAKAMSLDFGMIGKPQYFDARTPTGWPAALVPANAKVIGGGVIGDSARFRMLVAVFVLADKTKPDEMLRTLVTRAGYGPPISEPAHGEGFVSSAAPLSDVRYCKGSSMAAFETVDTIQGAVVVAIRLLDGESGKQNCAPQQARMIPNRFPITLPTMTPPPGVISFGGGSNWGGNGGTVSATLRTTLRADSILYHYTPQLVAGGWKSEGKPAIGDGVAVQRFSFRDDKDKWEAALIVTRWRPA